jgi:hypothetical protein
VFTIVSVDVYVVLLRSPDADRISEPFWCGVMLPVPKLVAGSTEVPVWTSSGSLLESVPLHDEMATVQAPLPPLLHVTVCGVPVTKAPVPECHVYQVHWVKVLVLRFAMLSQMFPVATPLTLSLIVFEHELCPAELAILATISVAPAVVAAKVAVVGLVFSACP